jgi:hypothetical protein
MDPWPSTRIRSGEVSAAPSTSCSAAPAAKSETTASTQIPHPAMTMPVWPVATNFVETPLRRATSSTSRVAVILPMALFVPTVSATFGSTLKPSPEKSGTFSVPYLSSGELRPEPLVEAADDLEPSVRGTP